MDTDIAAVTDRLLQNYENLKGGSKRESPLPAFWDLVVLTAADEVQRDAYEQQIQQKIHRKEIPPDIPYHVLSDPPGAKIGCGGSTMFTINELYARYGKDLETKRILLIHAGGQSKRLPSASVLGKIFSAVPVERAGRQYQLFELKLAGYLPYLDRMPPGFFHSAGDELVVYALGDDWTFEKPGVTALAHPSSTTIGTTHGVYVLETGNQNGHSQSVSSMRDCTRVLQKPSIETMEKAGAILHKPVTHGNGDKQTEKEKKEEEKEEEDGSFVYTDSAFFFDHQVAKKLMEYYRSHAPLQCEIDSYGDFLTALGSNATDCHISNVENVTSVQGNLFQTRREIFQLLKGTPLNVIALNKSKFYHFGTTREYIHHFCNDDVIAREVGFSRETFSYLNTPSVTGSPTKMARLNGDIQGTLMHSIIPQNSTIHKSSVVEYSHFQSQIEIADNCIVSNCMYEGGAVTDIPSCTFMHTVPIKLENHTRFVTLLFHVDDNLKKKTSLEKLANLLYFTKPISNLYEVFQLTISNLFPEHDMANVASSSSGENTTDNVCYNLWNAKLFPALNTMSESFDMALKMLVAIAQAKPLEMKKHTRLSMEDVLKYKDVAAMLRYRQTLYDTIRVRKVEQLKNSLNNNGKT